MTRTKRQRFRQLRQLVLAGAAIWVGGCISGSLASNTGPRPPGASWSEARHQMISVGETVRFDFVLHDLSRRLVNPLGLADYCVTKIRGERIETEPDLTGHFQFNHTFNDIQAGREFEVRTNAYRRRGGRDFMKVRGQWLQSEAPFDRPDKKVAGDSIRFTVYETPIELTIARPESDLDLDSGVLRIRRSDGSTTRVYIDRPHRPGFTVSGPEPDAYYRIRYMPVGTELNQIGTTEVEFVIYDIAGRPHYASVTLETP